MADTNNEKEKLFFADDMLNVLEELLGKIKNRQPLFGQIMMSVVKDLIFGKIQEKDFTGALQQKLKISQADAENLSKELKLKVIPLIKKVPEGEGEESEETEVPPTIKPPISVADALQEKPIVPAKRQTKNKNQEEVKKFVPPQTQQKRGPDNYREPIE